MSDITLQDEDNMHKLVEFYLGSIDNIGENYAQNLIDMFTDAGFLFGTYKTIKYMQDQNMTVYQYILTYSYLHNKPSLGLFMKQNR